MNGRIKASFGPTVIADATQSKYDKQGGANQQNKPSLNKKQSVDPMETLYNRVQYQFNTNYVPEPPFKNKDAIEKYDVNKIKANFQIDMSKFDKINPMLNSYNNSTSQSAFPDHQIDREVELLLA